MLGLQGKSDVASEAAFLKILTRRLSEQVINKYKYFYLRMTSFIPGSKVVIIVSTELCKIRIQFDTSIYPNNLLLFLHIDFWNITGNVKHKYTNNICMLFCFYLFCCISDISPRLSNTNMSFSET